MLEQIVDKYDLTDKSKVLRCLMDYVEEKEDDWDDMFATVRCNRCGQELNQNLMINIIDLLGRIFISILFFINGILKIPFIKNNTDINILPTKFIIFGIKI